MDLESTLLSTGSSSLTPRRPRDSWNRSPRLTSRRSSRPCPPRLRDICFRASIRFFAAQALALLHVEHAARDLAAIRHDAAAAILRAMHAVPRASVLNALPTEERRPLTRLLRYSEGTAGALMDPSVLSIDAGHSRGRSAAEASGPTAARPVLHLRRRRCAEARGCRQPSRTDGGAT